MDRRTFLTTSAGAIAAVSARAYAAPRTQPRRVGVIGPGWYGKCDLTQMMHVEPLEVVSLCDVDQNMLKEAGEIVAARQPSKKTPRLYGDYRKMLAEKDLDIVIIDTPDHWHALQMIAAVEAGCDVWVQKPISVDVVEGQAMVAAARKHQRVVQVGMQRRSTPHLIEARDRVIREGLLGDIAYAEVYCYYHMRARQNPMPKDPPSHLDYEMWTGPAPLLPYTEMTHPRSWRAFMEYGNGILGDMCVHMLDMVRWMLDLGWPSRISSSGGILVQNDSRANISDTQQATFEFEQLPIVWTHRSWGTAPDPEYPWGATIYGDKGTLKLSVQKYDFIPQGRGQPLHGEAVLEFDKYPQDEKDKDALRLETHVASAIRGHARDFLKAVDERTKPVADIEQGHISAASCILANQALKLGRTIHWDAQAQKAIGDDEANALLRRAYRAPWVHPEVT